LKTEKSEKNEKKSESVKECAEIQEKSKSEKLGLSDWSVPLDAFDRLELQPFFDL